MKKILVPIVLLLLLVQPIQAEETNIVIKSVQNAIIDTNQRLIVFDAVLETPVYVQFASAQFDSTYVQLISDVSRGKVMSQGDNDIQYFFSTYNVSIQPGSHEVKLSYSDSCDFSSSITISVNFSNGTVSLPTYTGVFEREMPTCNSETIINSSNSSVSSIVESSPSASSPVPLFVLPISVALLVIKKKKQ